MKKALFLLIIPFLFSCSDDDDGKTNTGILFNLYSPDWIDFYDIEGATVVFFVTIPEGQNWIVEDCPDWCAVSKKSSKWDEKIEITISPNNQLQGRTGNIVFGIYDSDMNPVSPFIDGSYLEINQKGKISGTWKKETGDNSSIFYSFNHNDSYVFRQSKYYPDKFKINIELDYFGSFKIEEDVVNIDLKSSSILGQYALSVNDNLNVVRDLFNQLMNQFIVDNNIQFDEKAKPEVKPIIQDPLNYTIKVLDITKNSLLIDDPLRGGAVMLYPAEKSEKIY